MKLKLMTIVGTRPEIIKLSAVIRKCDRYFDQILVHTGQNYDYTLNEVIKDGGYKVIFHTDDLYSSDFQDDVKSVRTFYEQMFLNEGKKITYIQFYLK
jgi:UDP-N-acetylglucosamine 2-epimerase (non-hydrolysing)